MDWICHWYNCVSMPVDDAIHTPCIRVWWMYVHYAYIRIWVYNASMFAILCSCSSAASSLHMELWHDRRHPQHPYLHIPARVCEEAFNMLLWWHQRVLYIPHTHTHIWRFWHQRWVQKHLRSCSPCAAMHPEPFPLCQNDIICNTYYSTSV